MFFSWIRHLESESDSYTCVRFREVFRVSIINSIVPNLEGICNFTRDRFVGSYLITFSSVESCIKIRIPVYPTYIVILNYGSLTLSYITLILHYIVQCIYTQLQCIKIIFYNSFSLDLWFLTYLSIWGLFNL